MRAWQAERIHETDGVEASRVDSKRPDTGDVGQDPVRLSG